MRDIKENQDHYAKEIYVPSNEGLIMIDFFKRVHQLVVRSFFIEQDTGQRLWVPGRASNSGSCSSSCTEPQQVLFRPYAGSFATRRSGLHRMTCLKFRTPELRPSSAGRNPGEIRPVASVRWCKPFQAKVLTSLLLSI